MVPTALRSIHIESYGSLFDALARQGFTLIGVTFVHNQEEVEGLRPAEFRMAGLQRGWPVSNTRQKWSQVTFAASQQDNMLLMDVASRVAFGLQQAEMLLCDLVSAYAKQLGARSRKNEGQGYQRFKDLNSPEVYKAIHALFWELAVLRDTLAEFVASFCLARGGVRTLAGLLRSLKKQPSPDPIAIEVLNSTEGTPTAAPGIS